VKANWILRADADVDWWDVLIVPPKVLPEDLALQEITCYWRRPGFRQELNPAQPGLLSLSSPTESALETWPRLFRSSGSGIENLDRLPPRLLIDEPLK
jgi:hypothetical protein